MHPVSDRRNDLMTNNCLTCRHLSHDAEKNRVCEKVYGWLACQHCKQIDTPINYCVCHAGFMHAACKRGQPVLTKHDWREGYLGNPVDGQLTPLPCCPGWEEQPEAKKPLEKQRNLFGDD